MQVHIEGAPAFAHMHVDLEPGESIVAEADAMASMSAEVDMQARLNGGLLSAFARGILGNESLFVNTFTNTGKQTQRITLTQSLPGDIKQLELRGDSICLQPGAYIASTPGLTLGVRYAGLASLIGREGLFKLQVQGTGTLWYGAYGALVEKQVEGEYIVDTGHLVAYEPSIALRMQLAGGLFSSLFGGEGLVTRLQGSGKVVLQSRSLSGLAGWLNPKL